MFPKDTPENDETRDFYYFTYSGNGIEGSAVISQYKLEDGKENPDGFNIAAAHAYLLTIFGRSLHVSWWQKTTKKRKDSFEAFIQSTYNPENDPEKAKRPSHLSIVRNIDGSDGGPLPPSAS